MATLNEEAQDVQRRARAAGVLYLFLFVAAPLAYLLTSSTVVVEHDAAATARSVIDHEARIRAGVLLGTVVFLLEVVLAALLYALFRGVSRTISLAAALSRVAAAVALATSLLASAGASSLLGGAGSLAALDAEQRDARAFFVLELHDLTFHAWGLFFALHLLLLGYLVFRSERFPSALGALLALASLGYFVESYGTLLGPSSSGLLAIVLVALTVPGELAFALWLALRGVRDEARKAAPVTTRPKEVPT